MFEIRQATPGSVKFLRIQLATARAFLDIAQTSRGQDALQRNLHNAEVAIAAINRVLTLDEIDRQDAEEIRSAARAIADQLDSFSAR